MSISNELSGEIAAAILVGANDSPAKLESLKLVVEQVRETLTHMETQHECEQTNARAAAAAAGSEGVMKNVKT